MSAACAGNLRGAACILAAIPPFQRASRPMVFSRLRRAAPPFFSGLKGRASPQLLLHGGRLIPLSRRTLVSIAISVYLLLCAAVMVAICRMTGGHFLYPLDDAYIHLALAQNLAHGHYGINPSEFTSPSSSLLWPFLITPFANTPWHRFVPLVLNLLCGCFAAGMLASCVARWLPKLAAWQQLTLTGLLLFCANLVSLSILGMEHVVQIALAVACALGVVAALEARSIPGWAVAGAVIAPSIRYEDLSLTLALCLALCGLKRCRTAAAVFCASIAPLLVFAAFLRSKGLPALPMSVLVKGDAFANASFAARFFHVIQSNLKEDLTHIVVRSPTFLLLFFFAWQTFAARTRLHRFVFAGALAVAVLESTIGRFGWFHRYEVYALIFLLLLAINILAQGPRPRVVWIFLLLLWTAPMYLKGTILTPYGSRAVYLQQYQMHRFETKFHPGNFAVNDLGLTGFERRPDAYLLDLGGLASEEAARNAAKTPDWLAAAAARHQANLAMVYPEYFRIPSTGRPLPASASTPAST